MKRRLDPKIRLKRVRHPVHGVVGDDRNGAFILRGPLGRDLFVMVSDGLGWDHLSASLVRKELEEPPAWVEMCWLKDQFFEPEETVIQYHPPQSQYVNFSECLHLWRPQEGTVPMPPLMLV